MAKVLCVWLAMTGLAFANNAMARQATGGTTLWSGCSAKFDSQTYYESYAACRAYITGVADVLSTGDSIAGRHACIPNNASKADITERVIGWLEANPSRRQAMPAHALVAEAIGTAYPCP